MIRRILIWLRQLIDPLWIPPEEMEAALREMQERIAEYEQKRQEADREH